MSPNVHQLMNGKMKKKRKKSMWCIHTGLPWWLSGKQSAYQCRSHGFNPWSGKIPWRRKWQPTPVFLPGEPMGRAAQCATVQGVRVRHDLATEQQQEKTPERDIFIIQ